MTLEALANVIAQMLDTIPDEERRAELQKALEAAKDRPAEYPYPEKPGSEQPIEPAKLNMVGTAIKLLGQITKATKVADAAKIIKQVQTMLKGVVGAEAKYDKPDMSIEYPTTTKAESGTALDTRVLGTVLEAVNGEKNRYKVVVAESGLGHNGNFYPLKVLKAHVNDYNNLPMYVDHDLAALASGTPSLKGDVATLVDPYIDESYECSNGSKGALMGTTVIHNPDWIKQMAVPEFRRRVGLSHIVQVKSHVKAENGKSINVIDDLIPKRVDFVSIAAQGGRVVESKQTERGGDDMPDTKIDESIRELRALKAKDEARDLLLLDESLHPKTKLAIAEEVAAIAKSSDEPIDVKMVTEAIAKRYLEAIQLATKDKPVMPGQKAYTESTAPPELRAASELGKLLYGKGIELRK